MIIETNPALFSDAPKRYHPLFSDLLMELFAKDPRAAQFDPCPCGVVMVVIPREHVKPWHYVVEDEELKARVLVRLQGTGFSQYEDGVLVLAEIA